MADLLNSTTNSSEQKYPDLLDRIQLPDDRKTLSLPHLATLSHLPNGEFPVIFTLELTFYGGYR